MFSINIDRRLSRTTAQKGIRLPPLLKMWEINRPGIARWPAVKSQGKLTIAIQPTDGETFTIDGKVYTFKNTLTESDGYIKIGGTIQQTIANIEAAINLSGIPGSQYANATTIHPTVEVTIKSVNDIYFTAKEGGTAGNSITLSETMVGAGNQWDAATLGGQRAGENETDAESFLTPSSYGGFPYIRTQSSGWAVDVDPKEALYRSGKGTDINGNDSDVWTNNTDMRSDFPLSSYKLQSGGSRKIWQFNYFDRRYNQLRSVGLSTYLKRVQNVTLAAPFTAHTSNIVFKTIELDSTRFILFFKQSGGTTGTYAVVGQTSADGSVTWGTPLQLDDDQYTNENFDAALISTDKILYSMRHGASNYIHVNVLSISSLTLTIGTPVQVAAIVSDRKAIVKIANDKALIAFINTTNINVCVVSVSGTTPSIGSVATITGGSQPIFAENGTDKAQICYILGSKWYTASVSASGTTAVANPGVQITNNGSFGFKGNNIWKLDTDKFLFYCPQGEILPYMGRDKYKFAIITVSGITSSLVQTSITELQSTEYDGNISFLKPLPTAGEYVFYRWTNGGNLRGSKVVITGNNITINDLMYRSSIYQDTRSDYPNYAEDEANNLQQIADPVITSHGTFFISTNNNEGGNINYWADRAFSFDVYLDDDLYGTFTTTIPGLIEPVRLSLNIWRDEFGIKIKSNDTHERIVLIDHAFVAID